MIEPTKPAEKPVPAPAPPPKKGRWLQPVVFVVMLLIWAVMGISGAAAFLIAYVLALLFVNFGLSFFGLQRTTETWSTKQRWLLFVCIAAAPLAVLVRTTLNSEPLRAVADVQERTRDKYYLETLPCLFPAFVCTDQPQRFLIYSPGSQKVAVQFEPKSAELPTEDLGHGLFLLDFDPRKNELAGADGAILETSLIADGSAHQRQIRLIKPRPHPRWFAAAPAKGLAATVSEETDELILVHRDGTARQVNVDDGPTDCALYSDGSRAVVCHRYHPSLCVVDTADGHIIERHDIGRSQVRLAVSPDEKLLAVALDGSKRGIQFLSLPDLKPKEFVSLPFSPDWIVFGRDDKEFIVTDRMGRNIYRMRNKGVEGDAAAQPGPPAAGAALADKSAAWKIDDPPIQTARPVVTLCRGPKGKEVIVSATASELGHEPITANHYVEDTIHHIDLESWQVVESYTTHRGGLEQDQPGTVIHGASPIGIAPVGDALLIAFAGSGDVAFDTAENGAALKYRTLDDGSPENPLRNPHGVADLGDGCWCVSSPTDSAIGVYGSDDELKKLIPLAPNEAALQGKNQQTLDRMRGEQTFYEATRSGVACQSCHTHTDTDYCLHSIGEDELVNVLSVRGVAGTAPYLREGEYQRLSELHDVAEEVYRDYFREVDWDRADALDSYMSSLPPKFNWRMLETHDAAKLRDGMNAFVKAECIACHVPPAMTNLGQHPAKLVFPEYGKFIDDEYGIRNFLDVPTLRSVSLSPPYLHDGRAQSLEEIFTKQNPSKRHGDTTKLSKEEFQALIDFLEQL